ncbi:GTP-binding protein Rho1 [Nowakowskiella sp. JEL0407]|nr:GTP-binding protein Rho1 [Nowakowskiella sp. JEL0407]
MSELRKKLVVVGDGASGKTSLLIRFSKDSFPEAYIPTVFETYVKDVFVQGKQIELALWDTAGQEEYDRLRPLSYSDAHVILITFSIDMPDSLENVIEKWIGEVKHFCNGVPVILVGCKKDLRTDPNIIQNLARIGQRPVEPEQAYEVAKRIGAHRYLECSAKSGEGVQQIFEQATAITLQPPPSAKPQKQHKKKKDCIVL